jgi:hypothetical protein
VPSRKAAGVKSWPCLGLLIGGGAHAGDQVGACVAPVLRASKSILRDMSTHRCVLRREWECSDDVACSATCVLGVDQADRQGQCTPHCRAAEPYQHRHPTITTTTLVLVRFTKAGISYLHVWQSACRSGWILLARFPVFQPRPNR